METETLAPPANAQTSTSQVVAVWDRLWEAPTSPQKDDRLVERERRSPRWKAILARLQSTFGRLEGLRTVELGCGRGDWSLLLGELGARVTLLDASGRGLAQARRRFERFGLSAEYVQSDLFDLPGPMIGGFDVALSSGVIEHFRGEDRSRALAAHVSVLRDGGVVVVSVPNAACLPYRIWKLYLEMRGCWPYGPEIPYSRRELRRRSADVALNDPTVRGFGWRQSLGDHVGRTFFGLNVDWSDRPSRLDRWMGLSLVLFARKGSARSASDHASDRC